MNKLLAAILFAAIGAAHAAPTADAVAKLKELDERRQEAVETGTDMISPETAYFIEATSKSLNTPLAPATPEEIRKVVKTAEFKAAMQPGRSEADLQIALMP